MIVDQELINQLFIQAADNPRKRMNYDMRTSSEDRSQQMLNAMLPGTEVPIHRHPISNENLILITGELYEILYEEVEKDGKLILHEMDRLYVNPSEGR